MAWDYLCQLWGRRTFFKNYCSLSSRTQGNWYPPVNSVVWRLRQHKVRRIAKEQSQCPDVPCDEPAMFIACGCEDWCTTCKFINRALRQRIIGCRIYRTLHIATPKISNMFWGRKSSATTKVLSTIALGSNQTKNCQKRKATQYQIPLTCRRDTSPLSALHRYIFRHSYLSFLPRLQSFPILLCLFTHVWAIWHHAGQALAIVATLQFGHLHACWSISKIFGGPISFFSCVEGVVLVVIQFQDKPSSAHLI